MGKYITMPLAEYEAMRAQIEELSRRNGTYLPNIDEIVFMPHRLYGYLMRQGIVNVANLETTRLKDWMSLPGFGKKAFWELKKLMEMYGLKFKEDESDQV